MAFVSQASRDLAEISKIKQQLGPGHYFPQQKQKNGRAFAPFLSTTRRTAESQQNQLTPGPGQYLAQQNLGDRNITTYQNKKSVILTIKSTGTSQFISNISRFEEKTNGIPGPGQYIQLNAKARKTRARGSRNSKLIETAFRKKGKMPSIPYKTLCLNAKQAKQEPYKDSRSDLGPGKYQTNDSGFLGGKLAVWGRDKVGRFQKLQASQIGPGLYEPEPVKRHSLSLKNQRPNQSFASNIVRTFFDKIYFKTNRKQEAQKRKTNKFKSLSPAPGTYDYSISKQNQQAEQYKNHSFGSIMQRFQAHREETLIPFYFSNEDSFLPKKSFIKRKTGFLSQQKRKSQFLTLPSQPNPGPGYYQGRHRSKLERIYSKVESFGSTTTRPFQKSVSQDRIGPGSYDIQKDPIRQSLQRQCNKESSTFKSKIPLSWQKKPNVDNKFGVYDVSNEDIARRVQQIRFNTDNLRELDIIIPPFSDGVPRFPHYETTQNNPKKQGPPSRSLQQIKNMAASQRQRASLINKNKQQLAINKKCPFDAAKNRFRPPPYLAPPVGQYSIRSNWTKKTYNVKYKNEKAKTQL